MANTEPDIEPDTMRDLPPYASFSGHTEVAVTEPDDPSLEDDLRPDDDRPAWAGSGLSEDYEWTRRG